MEEIPRTALTLMVVNTEVLHFTNQKKNARSKPSIGKGNKRAHQKAGR
jgi:hypothetical protein